MTHIRTLLALPHSTLVRRVMHLEGKVDDLTLAVELLTKIPETSDVIPEAFCPNLEGIHLTRQEARFLGALCRRPGAILSKENLLAAMQWDVPIDDWPYEKIVDVVACKVRKKVGNQVQIDTIWGVGYRVPAVKPAPEPAPTAEAVPA